MKTSEQINELAAALAKAQSEFEPPIKSKQVNKGGSYSYMYAPIEEVIAAVKPVLAKHGLSISQPLITNEIGSGLATRLMHASGQWIEGFILSPGIPDPQKLGGWITYMRRYALCGILGIAAEDDDDGQRASEPNPSPTSDSRKQNQSKSDDLPSPPVQPKSDSVVILEKLKRELSYNDEQCKEFLTMYIGKDSFKKITKEDMPILLKKIEEIKKGLENDANEEFDNFK